MKLTSLFFLEGNLKGWASALFGVIGTLAALCTIFYLDDLTNWRLWMLAIIAIVFGYGSAWAGLMKKWGHAPFTNDPLGWRKAKQSYKQEPSEQGEFSEPAQPQDDQTPKRDEP